MNNDIGIHTLIIAFVYLGGGSVILAYTINYFLTKRLKKDSEGMGFSSEFV